MHIFEAEINDRGLFNELMDPVPNRKISVISWENFESVIRTEPRWDSSDVWYPYDEFMYIHDFHPLHNLLDGYSISGINAHYMYHIPRELIVEIMGCITFVLNNPYTAERHMPIDSEAHPHFGGYDHEYFESLDLILGSFEDMEESREYFYRFEE